MPKLSFNHTPIVFIIYKRPETTKLTFQAIRNLRPKQLFIIADGPKNQVEKILTDQTREIVSYIDWPCDTKTNFAGSNQGLRKRVVSGLNWVFGQVDRAIILEDDCLAGPDFFQFCGTLLKKYQSNSQILSISGTNFQFQYHQIPTSYYFSRYPHCWGWATWKRAWNKFDDKLSSWPNHRDSNYLRSIFKDSIVVDYWTYIFNRSYAHQINSWDYPWTYAHFKVGGLAITPGKNLVTNLGFGNGATHTNVKDKKLGMQIETLSFPLNHPTKIKVDEIADAVTERTVYVNWTSRLIIWIKKWLKILNIRY